MPAQNTQNDELTRVKLRITALTARTVERGCTEAEAMAAAAMVGRLLERYALTMEEVDIRQQPCVQIAIPIGGKRRRPIDICVPAIARFCDCKVWLTRSELQSHYVFFGFDTDTQLAAYLFGIIDRAMQHEVACSAPAAPRGAAPCPARPRPVSNTASRSGSPSAWKPCTPNAKPPSPRSAPPVTP